MTWLELDDGILDHPKFVRAIRMGGSEAIHLWLGLRAHCGKYLTDGVIPKDLIDDVRGPKDPAARQSALEALITAGLLEDHQESVVMHHYLEWSASREQVIAARDRARERKAKFRGGHGGGNGGTPLGRTANEQQTSSSVPRRTGEGGGEGEGDLDLSSPGSGSTDQVNPVPPAPPPPLTVQAMAKLMLRDRPGAELVLQPFATWPEVKAIGDAFFETWGRRDDPRHGAEPRARAILERFAEGYTVEQLVLAVRRSKFADYMIEKQSNQALVTILRDAAQVDKFRALTALPKKPGEPKPKQPNGGAWRANVERE